LSIDLVIFIYFYSFARLSIYSFANEGLLCFETSLLKRRPSLNASGQTKQLKLLNQSLLYKFSGRKSSAIIS
jgi:hypothetical protein